MGVSEQPGGVVKTIAENLKGNPSCLAAICFAAIMAGLTYMTLRDDKQRTHDETMAMYERCWPLQDPEKE